jgi:hypothetical protein
MHWMVRIGSSRYFFYYRLLRDTASSKLRSVWRTVEINYGPGCIMEIYGICLTWRRYWNYSISPNYHRVLMNRRFKMTTWTTESISFISSGLKKPKGLSYMKWYNFKSTTQYASLYIGIIFKNIKYFLIFLIIKYLL